MSMAVSASAPRNVAGIATAALAFVALALLLDSPLWLVKLVPTQDGPVHLAQADLIARFGWGGTLAGGLLLEAARWPRTGVRRASGPRPKTTDRSSVPATGP